MVDWGEWEDGYLLGLIVFFVIFSWEDVGRES